MSSQLEQLYSRKDEFFFKKSLPLFLGLGLVFIAAVGYFLWLFPQNPTRAWGALLLNNLFFFLLSFGGVILGSIQDVCGASWGRPIKRFHETFGLFFYVSSSVFILFMMAIKYEFLEAHKVYKWIADPKMLDHFPGKNVWLQEDFFILRIIFMLVVMMLTVAWIRHQNTLADKSFLKGDLKKAQHLASLAQNRLRFWSAPLLFLLGTLFTFLMTDIAMSLSPLWFSTLWAGWLFAVLMQMLLAATLVVMFILRGTGVGSLMSRSQFHDVGKLLHGFSAFWAYLTYAHVLTYWYGNVPEETEYFIHRLHHPWSEIMIAIGIMAFVIPLFVLIPKPSKWTFGITFPLALIILLAQWLAHMVIVQPEVVDHGQFGWPLIEGTLFLAFLCLFISLIYLWGSRHMMVSLHDPLLKSQASHH